MVCTSTVFETKDDCNGPSPTPDTDATTQWLQGKYQSKSPFNT